MPSARTSSAVAAISSSTTSTLSQFLPVLPALPLTCMANTDWIIISSLTYKKDMLGQLEKASIAKQIVYELYNSYEFCDLLTIENVLQMK